MALTATSSLIQVFNDLSAICQNITDTNVYPDSGIQPGGVPSYFGEEYLKQNTAPPQWLWVPVNEQGGPPVCGGPAYADDPANDIIGTNTSPTPLASRNSALEIRCWGVDGTVSTDPLAPYQSAETLMNIFVQQAYAYASPMSFKYEGGAFDQIPEFTRAGRVYVARVTFRFPIVQPYARAVVSKYPIIPEITLPA